MIRILSLISWGIVLMIFFVAFEAMPLYAALNVKEVVLYPSSAMVFLEGDVFQGKTRTIELGYVPESAAKDSISVQVKPPFTLVEVYVNEVQDDPDRNMLRAEIGDLKMELSVLESQRTFIEHMLASKGRGECIGGAVPSLDRVVELVDGLGKKLASILRRIDAVRFELKKKERALGEWDRAHKWKVTSRVNGPRDMEVGVRLSYKDMKGGWRPVYNARLLKDSVEFTFNALLHQDSGVDWEGARVALSTAEPRGQVNPPKPAPLFLRPIEPLRIMRAKDEALVAKGESRSEMWAAPQEPATYREVEGTAVYSVPEPVTLPSGQDMVIQVKRWSSKASIRRLCFAEGDEGVYILADIKTLPTILPPGRVQLFQGDIRVGEAYFRARAPVDLNFGRDQALKVKRVMTKRFLDKKFGGKVEITLEYETTIYNNGQDPRVVEVVERIPVSQDERIKVAFNGAEPFTKPDPEKGFLKWILTVPPKDSAQVQYSFSVKYPEKLRLNRVF